MKLNTTDRQINTRNLLRAISSRMTANTKYSGMDIVVTISEGAFGSLHVEMVPNVIVFPNTHRRKDVDKLPLVTYALQCITAPYNISYDMDTGVCVCKIKLVPGIYKFAITGNYT